MTRINITRLLLLLSPLVTYVHGQGASAVATAGEATAVNSAIAEATESAAAAGVAPPAGASAVAGGPPAGGPPGGGGGPPPINQSLATATYYIPPIPQQTAWNNPKNLVLSNDFEITNITKTREYWFDIGKSAGAPDGYEREIYTVNNQYPGPLIEINEGDEVIIHVTNYLDEGQSIHWHGLNQNGTVLMDGIAGVTQCPIPPGKTFTYKFRPQGQYGNFWWHSHYANSMADGIIGPFIIHSVRDPIVRGRDYDEEQVVLIHDWQHDRADVVVGALETPDGYRGTIASPEPDAILINGVGRTNCTGTAIQYQRPCNDPPYPEIKVKPNKTYRLRIINAGTHALLRHSIDEHPYEVVDADGVPVYGPVGAHEIPIAPAQRYSIIVKTNKGKAGDSYWIREAPAVACMLGIRKDVGLAILRYTDDYGNCGHEDPYSQAWPDLEPWDAQCRDLDQYHPLVPRNVRDSYEDPLDVHVMYSNFGQFVRSDGTRSFGFGFNNVSFAPRLYNPLLRQLEDGGSVPADTAASATFWNNGPGIIIINNLDPGPLGHPYHLHGNDFQLLARGSGNITAEGFASWGYRKENPLRRDTLFIPGSSWAALRILTNNPGVWALHCHIGWHLSAGKLATIVVQPEAIKYFEQPYDWLQLCDGGDPNAIGPAKRSASNSEKIKSFRSRLLQRSGPREA
ncbi:hypothetical protein CI109_103757 [Kwoniella shandongensis]|uniref:Uncharacterized protein n=1 Tax=Kwoniella shandongensis TaxID=1734106 RepID=A0A5M6C7C4_9TREE|nr:uncharacterized protein CI109_000546 [Kwoniella shandongensis]KAA5530974.1 hypothetical protein CI109_000546 [Kwoniella shandongensis]